MNKLLNIMRKLRSPSGCPWDRKQSLISLRRCVLEEAHEVIEAISSKEKSHIEEELGDLLVVISMLITLGEEKNSFSKKSIMKRAIHKMIHRHPHVFAEKKARTANQALKHWDEAKLKEKQQKAQRNMFSDLKTHYPSLLLAYKVQRRAARVGFDWEDEKGALSKLEEELGELKKEVKKKNKKRVKEELGDLLFSTVNLARKFHVDPEIALKDTVRTFKKRFHYVEKQVQKSGKDWKAYSLNQLDRLWNQAKIKS